jgi:hypothetical protein
MASVPLSHELKSPSVVDPVCGMTVDPPRAASTRTYQGRTFYFCMASRHFIVGCCERYWPKARSSGLAHGIYRAYHLHSDRTDFRYYCPKVHNRYPQGQGSSVDSCNTGHSSVPGWLPCLQLAQRKADEGATLADEEGTTGVDRNVRFHRYVK